MNYQNKHKRTHTQTVWISNIGIDRLRMARFLNAFLLRKFFVIQRQKKLTSLGINPVFFLDDYFFSSQWINQQRGNFHPFLWFDFFFACFSFSKMEQFFFVLFRHKKNWEKISYSNIKRCSNLTFFFIFHSLWRIEKKLSSNKEFLMKCL